MSVELRSTFVLLTDSPPLKEGGHGCHVLSWNWIQAAGSNLKLIVTRRLNANVSATRVIYDLDVPCFIYPDLSQIPLLGRFPFLKSIVEMSLFLVWLPGIRRRILASGANRIFAFFGGNAWFLVVADLVARCTGLPLDIYLVDDLEASARAANQPIFARYVRGLEPKVLRRAKRVFTISAGFCEHLQGKYGLRTTWLPIPFPIDEVKHRPYQKTDPDVRDIVFLGAVNQLYLAPLRDLLEEIERWNDTTNPYRLRLLLMTYSDPEGFVEELKQSNALKILYRRSTIECRQHMSRSWAIFLPYTFEDEHRLMVSTSFPSKLAESLPAGRPLLIYGPAYASLPRYFLDNQLPLCITSRSELNSGLREIASHDTMAVVARYQAVLEQFHSSAALRKRLQVDGDRAG